MIRQRLKFYLAGVVSVIAFIVYLGALQNEFIQWDDNLYIFENQHIRSLDAAFFRWAFFDFYAGNWHPLTWMSHALDYAIWGLDPMGHHLTNNILHAINTFVAVLLVVRLLEAGNALTSPNEVTPPPSAPPYNPTRPPLNLRGGEGGVISKGGFTDNSVLIAAATTGLLFGLHPLHVESVAWVSERKDLLCALFFMLSVMMYLRYVTPPVLPLDKGRRKSEVGAGLPRPYGSQESENSIGEEGNPPSSSNPPSSPLKLRGEQRGVKIRANSRPDGAGGRGSYDLALSLLFFILALMSKPMAVTLPVVLLILDWYPLGRIQSLKAARSVFVEKVPFIVLSIISSAVTVFAQRAGGAIKSTEFAPFSTRLLVGVESLIVYLGKMILPVNLVPFYPYPKEASLVSLEYLSAIVLVSGITIACIMMARRQKLWLSAWGYYVIMLIPVLGIVQVGEQSMADRYTYLPSLGPFLVMGIMASWVWTRAERSVKQSQIIKLLTVTVSASLIISLSYLTFRQIGMWKSSIVLWSYVIEKEPERVLPAYLNRGVAYERTGQINRAIEDYDKAIAIDPLYFEAYNNRGVLYGQAGMFDKAIEYFNKSVGINPDFEDAYVNRGIAYALAGQYGRAMEDFNKAVLLNQDSAEAHYNRGNLYLRTGDRERAMSDFRKACDLGKEDGCARAGL